MFDFLHFDTISSTNNITLDQSSGVDVFNNKNSYDTTFTISNPLRNVKRIYLKSLEMPISFNNIRLNNGTNAFTFFLTSNLNVISLIYYIILDEKNYESIAALLLDINDTIASLLGNYNIIFSTLNNKIIISSTNFSGYKITFQDSRLLTVILGLKASFDYPLNNTITAYYNYLLLYDNYISLYFPDIPTKSTGYSNKLISFKIPLSAVNGTVYFLQDLNSFNQSIEITDQNFVINKLRVVVYDRFGLLLSNSLDYSFSLAVSYY